MIYRIGSDILCGTHPHWLLRYFCKRTSKMYWSNDSVHFIWQFFPSHIEEINTCLTTKGNLTTRVGWKDIRSSVSIRCWIHVSTGSCLYACLFDVNLKYRRSACRDSPPLIYNSIISDVQVLIIFFLDGPLGKPAKRKATPVVVIDCF